MKSVRRSRGIRDHLGWGISLPQLAALRCAWSESFDRSERSTKSGGLPKHVTPDPALKGGACGSGLSGPQLNRMTEDGAKEQGRTVISGRHDVTGMYYALTGSWRHAHVRGR